jgi:hypothetical protein
MVHIHWGQYWANCNGEEREGYKSNLEPVLAAGVDYLWENIAKT